MTFRPRFLSRVYVTVYERSDPAAPFLSSMLSEKLAHRISEWAAAHPTQTHACCIGVAHLTIVAMPPVREDVAAPVAPATRLGRPRRHRPGAGPRLPATSDLRSMIHEVN